MRSSHIKVGTVVRLHGLSARGYNGRVGHVEDWVPDEGRWSVALSADPIGPAESGLLLKAVNLQVVTPAQTPESKTAPAPGSREEKFTVDEEEEEEGATSSAGEDFPQLDSESSDDGLGVAAAPQPATTPNAPSDIVLRKDTQNLMDEVRMGAVSTSSSASSSPSRSPKKTNGGSRRASSLDPSKQTLADDVRLVEAGHAPMRIQSDRRRINSLGKSIHSRRSTDDDADGADEDGVASTAIAFADGRNTKTIVSASTRQKLREYYTTNQESRYPKNVRSAPGRRPHLSYEEAMAWTSQCHPRVIDTTVKKGNRRHSFCKDAFGWHLCRCRKIKCGSEENRSRLDYLQQSTFDRYGIGISLYFKYLKLLIVTYAVLFFFVGAPTSLLYYFYDDGLGRLVAASPSYDSVFNALNLAFNQLTIGNLGTNDRFCASGAVNTSTATTTSIFLDCEAIGSVTVSNAYLGVFDGTCDCPAEQAPTNGVCPGDLYYQYDASSNLEQLCEGYCYPGTLDTVGASCCSHSVLAGSSNEANFTDLAVAYTSDTCRAPDRALYALLSSQCDGDSNCTISLNSNAQYPIADIAADYLVDDGGTALYTATGNGSTVSTSLGLLLSNFSLCGGEVQDVRLLVTYQCNAPSDIWSAGWEFLSKDQIRLLCSLLDFVGCLFFLVNIFFLKAQEDSAVYLLRTKNLTADDYTVMLTNLPKHNSLWQLERHIREHFDRRLNDTVLAESMGLHWNPKTQVKVADVNFGVEKSAEMINLLKERGLWVQRLYTINAKIAHRHTTASAAVNAASAAASVSSQADQLLTPRSSFDLSDAPVVGLVDGVAGAKDPRSKDAAMTRNQKAREDCKSKINALDAALRALEGPGGSKVRATVAFVTFSTEEGFLRCNQLYFGGAISVAVQPKMLRFENLPIDNESNADDEDKQADASSNSDSSSDEDDDGTDSKFRDFTQPTKVTIAKSPQSKPREIEMPVVSWAARESDEASEDKEEAESSNTAAAEPEPTESAAEREEKAAKGGFAVGDDVVLKGLKAEYVLDWCQQCNRWINGSNNIFAIM